MYTIDSVLERFQPIIGKSFPYSVHDDVRAEFMVSPTSIQCGHYMEPVQTKTDVWYTVGNIYWGQGYHSTLYGNMCNPEEITLVAVNGFTWDGSIAHGTLLAQVSTCIK